MNSEAIPFPTGKTLDHLYNHQRNLTAVLRRIFVAIQEGGVDLTSINTAIAELEADVVAVQADNASFETVIAAETVLGSLAEVAARQETQLEANARATIAASVEAHRAGNGVRSMVSVTDGHSQLITSLNSAIGVTNANVTTLQTTVADGDAALAAGITTLETTVAGNTASIAVVQTSVNGIATRYGVYLNAQNEVIGYLQLDGTPSGSVFTVAVDNFRVAKVGTTGGASVPVFAIQTVNGSAKIAFIGDMIADGTITTNALAANSVVASKIAAKAITADKISVTNLSSINNAFGTATFTGVITGGPTGKMIIDVTNGKIYRPDGKMTIDFEGLMEEIIF